MSQATQNLGNWNDHFPHWAWPIRMTGRLSPWLLAGPRDESELEFAKMIDRAPKTELHVHVEAAVAAEFYRKLNAKKALIPKGLEPTEQMPFADFNAFIQAWLGHTRLITEPDDYHEMGRNFVQERAAQNITYSEAHTSVIDTSLMRRRKPDLGQPLPIADCLLALCAGIQSELKHHPTVTVHLIVDLLWFTTIGEKNEVLDALEFVRSQPEARSPTGKPLIVGIGMGGLEVTANAASFTDVVDRARSMDLIIDLHSGETASASDASQARTLLRPDRIAHGIAGAPNDFFEGHTAACPLSNLFTQAWPESLNQHPIRAMSQSGCAFSVNTDDPLLFSTTLALEYVALRNAFGWDYGFFESSQHAAAAAQSAKLLAARGKNQA